MKASRLLASFFDRFWPHAQESAITDAKNKIVLFITRYFKIKRNFVCLSLKRMKIEKV